jgi:preprotein translocase subunit SecG
MSPILLAYVIPAIHVFACLFLIVVVLLQTGKGADMGAVFGGGSQTLFGSSGAGNFLTKLTAGTAIAFMVTSLILTYGASRNPNTGLLRRLPTAAAEPAPSSAPAATDQPLTPPSGAEAPAAPAEAPVETPPAGQ